MQPWRAAYHSLDYYWILRQNSGFCLCLLDVCNVKLGLDAENEISGCVLTVLIFCLRHLQAQILV